MKRPSPLFLVLLLATVARAQTPAPVEANPSMSSTPPAPAAVVEAPSASPAAPSGDSAASPASPQPGAAGAADSSSTEGSQAATPVPAEGPASASAPAKADQAPEGLPTVAVLSLEANKAAQEAAPGIASLLASRLAESPKLKVLTQRDIETMLSTERQRQILGSDSCSSQGPCLEELSNAIGARFVVTGRLDQFGDKYLLTVSLLDTFSGRSLARPRAEASSSEDLPQIADAIGQELLVELIPPEGQAPGSSAKPLLGSIKETPGGGFVLGLRINNSFIENLAALNPGGDVELGYAFHPEWVGFLQVGFNFIRSTGEGEEGRLRVLPSVLGARHYYRIEKSLRPYWGLGLGVQLSFGDFGIFKSTGPLPTVIGFFGAEYVFAGKLGITVEAGTNLAQATLGLAENGLGDGLNLDLTAGIVYHF